MRNGINSTNCLLRLLITSLVNFIVAKGMIKTIERRALKEHRCEKHLYLPKIDSIYNFVELTLLTLIIIESSWFMQISLFLITLYPSVAAKSSLDSCLT